MRSGDGDVDYSRYTDAELGEALAAIRPDQYPKNYANLVAALDARGLSNVDAGKRRPISAPIEAADAPSGPHKPNSFSVGQLAYNLIVAIAVIGYGGYGLWVGDLYLPGRRGSGMHLQGTPAWLMYAAMLCISATLLSTLVDHFDERDNESVYKQFAAFGGSLGLFLMILAIVIAPETS